MSPASAHSPPPSEPVHTPVPAPCPICGYPLSDEPCARCQGTATVIASGEPVRIGRRWFPADLMQGAVSYFEGGLHLFNRPEFTGRLALPITANLVVFGALFAVVVLGCGALFDWALSSEWWVLDGLRQDLHGGSQVALVIATAMLLCPTLFEVATGAFLDPLADTTERLMTDDETRSEPASLWRGALRGSRESAQLLVVELILLAPMWGLSLVPVVGIPLVFVLTSALAAIVWFEVPVGRRGYGLPQRLRVVRRNWAKALGFGMAFQLGMFVPIFNIVMLTPAAAVSTSMLYFHFEKGPGEG